MKTAYGAANFIVTIAIMAMGMISFFECFITKDPLWAIATGVLWLTFTERTKSE